MTKHVVLIDAGRATFERFSEDVIEIDYWFPGLIWIDDETFKLAGKIYDVIIDRFVYRKVIAQVQS